jgi:hypothetical protein
MKSFGTPRPVGIVSFPCNSFRLDQVFTCFLLTFFFFLVYCYIVVNACVVLLCCVSVQYNTYLLPQTKTLATLCWKNEVHLKESSGWIWTTCDHLIYTNIFYHYCKLEDLLFIRICIILYLFFVAYIFVCASCMFFIPQWNL